MHPSTLQRMLVDGPVGGTETDINDPGASRRGGHFFHGRLHLLARIVTQYCRP